MHVEDMVIELLQDLSGLEHIAIKDSLQTELGLDSLMMVTLLIELEEVFHIQLKESDMNPFDLNTVTDVIALVEKYEDEKHEES